MAGATSNYFNMKRSDVTNSKPGYQNKVWLAPVSWFDTLSKPAPGAFGEDKNTIVTDHTFNTGFGFIECYIQPNQNTATGETKGDLGGMYMHWKASVVFPGDNAKMQALFEEIMNEDLIVLFKDADCDTDTVYQFGCDCNPSNPSSMKQDGSKRGDAKSKNWTIDLESDCRSFYKGTITLFP